MKSGAAQISCARTLGRQARHGGMIYNRPDPALEPYKQGIAWAAHKAVQRAQLVGMGQKVPRARRPEDLCERQNPPRSSVFRERGSSF